MNVIEIRNLSKKYSNSRNVEVMALRHVNLNIEKGRFICNCRPSGSSKKHFAAFDWWFGYGYRRKV